MSLTLNQASSRVNREWMSRPGDERFLSLTDMHAFMLATKTASRAKVVSSRQLTAAPAADDIEGLQILGPDGHPAGVTHWAFGQLAARAEAPAGYLRTLPSPMAADCINFGLHHARGPEDIGVLLTRAPETSAVTLRAATGPNYGRIWNETIVRALISRFGDGVTGEFRVPGEFGKPVPVTKQNTTLYASDRDMFVFLVDEEHRIEVPGRRDGATGSLARGFFLWNSEVGAATCGIGMFLFDYVCCNRLIWGMQDFSEISFRHTASAPDRWIETVAPAIHAYADSSTRGVSTAVAAAQAKKIGDADKVREFLASRFTKPQTSAIIAAHMADEQRPIESLWDAATAVTAYARGIEYQDDRVRLEREAGKILSLAS